MGLPTPRILLVLERFPLLDGVDRATLRRLSELAREQLPWDGKDIFVTGDAADGLRLIVDGRVRLWVNDRDGRELTIAVLTQGDSLGEVPTCDGLPHPVNATATGEVRLLFFERAALLSILHAEPRLMDRLAKLLSSRLRSSIASQRHGAFDSLRFRLGRALCELADHHAECAKGKARFERRIPQSELARHLGVTRESVNKQLRAIRDDGHIAMTQGRIVIEDLPAFRAVYMRQV